MILGKTTTVILDSNKNDAGNENRNRLGNLLIYEF